MALNEKKKCLRDRKRKKVWSNTEQSNRKVNIAIVKMTRELIGLNPEMVENRPERFYVFMKIKEND